MSDQGSAGVSLGGGGSSVVVVGSGSAVVVVGSGSAVVVGGAVVGGVVRIVVRVVEAGGLVVGRVVRGLTVVTTPRVVVRTGFGLAVVVVGGGARLGVSGVKIDVGEGDVLGLGVAAGSVGLGEPLASVGAVDVSTTGEPNSSRSSPWVALAALAESGSPPVSPTMTMNANSGSTIRAAPAAEPRAMRRGHAERGARCVPT